MTKKINWEATEKSRQYQINRLIEGYNQTCQDLVKEKQALRGTSDPAEIKKHQYYIKKSEQKKLGYKRVLLEKYGVKLEKRGRPSLPEDKKAASNQIKLTVRLQKENAEYIASLKKDKVIESYAQFFDSIIEGLRQ